MTNVITTPNLAAVVDGMLAELRRERIAGRSRPELIEAGTTALRAGMARLGLSKPRQGELLTQVLEEIVGRIPAAHRSANPELEEFLIQTAAEVVDRARPHWSEWL